jgi:putative ATPase
LKLAPACKDNTVLISEHMVQEALQTRTAVYDKTGEYHYDVISAFIKSVRGSDPNAALYWLARMIDAGEDPKFIARRLIILASEDIGNADPHALTVATSAFTAVTYIGMPEGRIILAQAATYLAAAPKSNASYSAIAEALHDISNSPPQPVPLHLRNAPTGLMKSEGYAEGYLYAHDYPENFVDQKYLPESLMHKIYYRPTENGAEKRIKDRLSALWSKYRTDSGNNDHE